MSKSPNQVEVSNRICMEYEGQWLVHVALLTGPHGVETLLKS